MTHRPHDEKGYGDLIRGKRWVILFSELTDFTIAHKPTDCRNAADLKGFKLRILRQTIAVRLIDLSDDSYMVTKLLGHLDMRTSIIDAKSRKEIPANGIKILEEAGYHLAISFGRGSGVNLAVCRVLVGFLSAVEQFPRHIRIFE